MAVKRRKAAKRRKPAKRKTKRRGGGGGLTKLQYHLSPELAEVVGTRKASRPQVVKKLWQYIKAKRLQDNKNRRMINPDKKLGEVLGNRQISMLKMAGAISKHLKKA
ncbi:MAG: SWIB/MDM2 domain-containing protein [Verrucomicrobia bacterium]|nr:SWIB/MDM2 domain-containing protein [Verrucomicrobiota bacterium]MBU6445795.1 SWIB/MDM2 domain-containing protein [Verrucomicrobiota bacterium]MDE3047427.1 SWIB/MDM2 domain-containing protein [Verrucomicrobiota bacterium]